MHLILKCPSLAISQELFPSHLSETYPYFSCSQWCHLHQVHCSESKHSSCQDWKRMHTISTAGLVYSSARQFYCYAHNPRWGLRISASQLHPAFWVKALWWMEIVSSGEQWLDGAVLGKREILVVLKKPFYKLFHTYNFNCNNF